MMITLSALMMKHLYLYTRLHRNHIPEERLQILSFKTFMKLSMGNQSVML